MPRKSDGPHTYYVYDPRLQEIAGKPVTDAPGDDGGRVVELTTDEAQPLAESGAIGLSRERHSTAG